MQGGATDIDIELVAPRRVGWQQPVVDARPVSLAELAANVKAQAGAAASGRFFNKMEGAPGAGQTDHRDFMSPSELRLLSEWLDIGAQYYNDPFVAPAN